jgi:hypothetical protein
MTTAEENQKRIDNAIRRVREFNESLLKRGTLTLVVELKTIEDAEQIHHWMYGPEDSKPMSAKLNTISWDQALINSDLKQALDEFLQVANQT